MNARPADKLAIAVAQLNSTVGDIAGNAEKVRRARADAAAQGADLVVFPELFIAGYPPEDLVLKPAFQAACRAAVEALARETASAGPALLVGTPWLDDGKLYNAVALLDGGAIAALRYKVDLPNYGVFDEKRVFAPGPMPGPVNFRGVRLGLPICEDIWGAEIVECLAETGAEMLVVPNGSPYWRQKGDVRLNIAVARVTEQGLPTVYVNQVGAPGRTGVRRRFVRLCTPIVRWRSSLRHFRRPSSPRIGSGAARPGAARTGRWSPPSKPIDADYAACVLGLARLRQQERLSRRGARPFGRHRFRAVRGDGGRCAGPERVRCVMMPYKFTAQESLDDAAACAKALGVHYDILPIAPAVEGLEAALAPAFTGLPRDVTEENLQARARGTILMAISNKFNVMVVTTGNKSEMSVGYATLYGDMNGGFNPIKDLYKTEVFRLSRLRNGWKPEGAMGPDGAVIPENIITRPPTAELRENQKDEDSLPPYAVLDPILERLVEREEPISAIVAAGFDRDTVMRIERMLNIAEYKRRQAAPGVKVTLKNFGRDRRYPITNRFRDPGTPLPAPDASLVTGKPAKTEAFDF